MNSPGNNRIVILLGTNFSGSHLLSHLLSAHPRCLGVGEIHRFQQLLGTGSDAPVVAQYNSDPLFDGLVNEPVETWHGILLTRFANRFAVDDPVVVDNSKKVDWAERISRNSSYDIRFVHLVRDPRALVLRWLKTYDTPRLQRRQRLRIAKRTVSRALPILRSDIVTAYIYKWLRENQQIAGYLAKPDRQASLVTYHDMVFNTEPMLRRLMPDLGLEFDSAQLRFGEGTNFGTRKTAHTEAVARSEIRPDVKWQSELTAAAIETIETNPDIGRFIEASGLRFDQNGLVSAAG